MLLLHHQIHRRNRWVGLTLTIEQAQDAILVLQAALVMSEVKRVDAGLGL
jgi:hypothetical protein